MLSYFFSVFAFRGETNIASGELDNGGSTLCCIGWSTVFFCVCVCVCVCRSEVDLVIREDCYPFHKRGYEPKKKITRAFRPLNHPSYRNTCISYDVLRCCLKHVSKYSKLEFNQYLTFLFIKIMWPKNSNLSMGRVAICKESSQLEIIKKSEITKKAPARSLFYRKTRNICFFVTWPRGKPP